MANLWDICKIQLLCAFFTLCLLVITSADVRSVHTGENITLPCNITNYPEISWYRLRSDEVKLLIAAEKWNMEETYSLSYNVDKSHFNYLESSGSVSLVITGVKESDLGFYYCGGQRETKHAPTQYGKLIRLKFTGIPPAPKNDMEIDNLTKHQDTLPSKGAEFWISVCVCPVFILISVFCCIVKGKSLLSCRYSRNAIASSKEEENIRYASVQCKRGSKATAKKNTALESVIYATVAPKPQRH